MADEVRIDKEVFHDRLASFISQWKRSGDAFFGGANSIVILVGKADETATFRKNNGFQVRLHTLAQPHTTII